MNNIRQLGGRKPLIRPEVPKADYSDEISDETFVKIAAAVADLNDPDHKRTPVSGNTIFPDD